MSANSYNGNLASDWTTLLGQVMNSKFPSDYNHAINYTVEPALMRDSHNVILLRKNIAVPFYRATKQFVW